MPILKGKSCIELTIVGGAISTTQCSHKWLVRAATGSGSGRSGRSADVRFAPKADVQEMALAWAEHLESAIRTSVRRAFRLVDGVVSHRPAAIFEDERDGFYSNGF